MMSKYKVQDPSVSVVNIIVILIVIPNDSIINVILLFCDGKGHLINPFHRSKRCGNRDSGN